MQVCLQIFSVVSLHEVSFNFLDLCPHTEGTSCSELHFLFYLYFVHLCSRFCFLLVSICVQLPPTRPHGTSHCLEGLFTFPTCFHHTVHLYFRHRGEECCFHYNTPAARETKQRWDWIPSNQSDEKQSLLSESEKWLDSQRSLVSCWSLQPGRWNVNAVCIHTACCHTLFMTTWSVCASSDRIHSCLYIFRVFQTQTSRVKFISDTYETTWHALQTQAEENRSTERATKSDISWGREPDQSNECCKETNEVTIVTGQLVEAI